MVGNRVVVFDIETRLGPDDKRFENKDMGWDALRRGEGGISAIAIWDSKDNWCYLYDDHEIEDAVAHLELADQVVGYSSENFDIPCIEGVIDRKIRIKEHIDILPIIWDAIRARDNFERMKGYKLKEVAFRCLGRGKIEHGSNVSDLLEKGRYGRVFNYCLDDVHLTRDILIFIQKEGGIVDAKGQFLALDLPKDLPYLGTKD
jgi:hypothetical protein